MSIAQKSLAFVAVLAVTVAVAFSFVATIKVAQAATLTESQISSILSLLQSFGADASTVSNVEASLRGTAPSGGTSGGGSMSGSCTFTRDLTLGSTGADVTCLQSALVAAGHLTMPAGVPMGYFGTLTQAAVSKWQASAGVTPTAGYFGPKSRAAFNLGGGTSGGGGTTPTGSGLSISGGSQPANSLAPENTSRVPFTRFTVTAGNDGDVVMNSVVVQRTGLGSNAAFSGVILVDDQGNQLGTSKTFNSNDQATIGEAVTIPRGTSRTFTVAANMASTLDAYAGEAPAISVVSVNTSATVSGSLPITGAYHTINATLTTGTITLAASSANASNANSTREIGTTAYKTTGFRLTAGSAEDLRLRMIRFNQTGSASTVNDLANVKVVVNGTAYAATVSADGKYITANFGGGILIAKGNNAEVYVQYDIIGSNASGRTIVFDVDRTTDVYATGETYGYGISPVAPTSVSVPTSRGTLTLTSGTPYIYSTQVTVTGASVTTIAKATTVAAQNIAVNVPDQPLGGFTTDIKGEAITVQTLAVSVATSTVTGSLGQLTNVTIVDENGSVVAGPIDTSGAGTTLTFTDSITFPTGKKTYTIRGKVASTILNNTVYTLSTNPSTQWSNVKGDVTGNNITLSQGSFTMNAMTVKAGSVTIGRASSPASQTIVPGGTSVHMVNFQFDATQSGEDIRFSSAPVQLAVTGGLGFYGDPDLLTSCQLFDGANALNTGSNVLNPTHVTTGSGTTTDTDTLLLDNPVTVTKGTVKTLGMRCNISSSANSASEFVWDVQNASNWSFSGATSGTTIDGSDAAGDPSIVVTIGGGATTVTTDASSPSYKFAAAGATDVTIGALRFRATNEALNLTTLGLTLTNTASSTSGDLVKVSIYDGATHVGDAFFASGATTATSTLFSAVSLPKDQDKVLTLKANFANIGIGQAVTFSGHLVAVDYLNAEGNGADSGSTQKLGSAAFSGGTTAGARVAKSFPTVAAGSLPTSGLADGRVMRFSVTADSKGPISLAELNFTFATSTITGLTNVNVYVYEDSNYSIGASGLQAGGMFSTTLTLLPTNGTVVEFTAFNGTASTTFQIPAGATRYFEVRGTASGVVSGSSITTTLKNGSAFVTCTTPAASTSNPMCKAAAAGLTNDFIWSPNSTTTPALADQDWTGGYGLSGLPTNGLIQTRSN